MCTYANNKSKKGILKLQKFHINFATKSTDIKSTKNKSKCLLCTTRFRSIFRCFTTKDLATFRSNTGGT